MLWRPCRPQTKYELSTRTTALCPPLSPEDCRSRTQRQSRPWPWLHGACSVPESMGVRPSTHADRGGRHACATRPGKKSRMASRCREPGATLQAQLQCRAAQRVRFLGRQQSAASTQNPTQLIRALSQPRSVQRKPTRLGPSSIGSTGPLSDGVCRSWQ